MTSRLPAHMPRHAVRSTVRLGYETVCALRSGDVLQGTTGQWDILGRAPFTRQKSLVRTQPRPPDETARQRLGAETSSRFMDGHSGMGLRRGHPNLVLAPSHLKPRRERGAVHLTRTVVASTGRSPAVLLPVPLVCPSG